MHSRQKALVACFAVLCQLGATHQASASPPANDLLNALGPCAPLPGVSKFKTDESQATANIPMCQHKNVIWFKADFDIDCDGGSSAACKADASYQSDTSCVASTGKALDASVLPFFVLPLNSNGFKTADHGIACGTVGAVIYNGKVDYAILGDRGPKGVLGEGSYALARNLGINPDPNKGGVASGVTYLVFTGPSGVLSSPIESHSKAQSLGSTLADALIRNSAQPASSIKSRILNTATDQWKQFGSQTEKDGVLTHKGHSEGDEGYWQRVVVYWKEGVGIQTVTTREAVMSSDLPWSAAFVSYVMKKSGAGKNFVYAPSHSTYINAAISNAKKGDANAAFVGHKVTEYQPKLGDLVCAPRGKAVNRVNFDNAVAQKGYTSHCDIVVAVRPTEIDVIGGNVSNSVTRNTIRTVGGKVVPGPGRPWFVVIENRLN